MDLLQQVDTLLVIPNQNLFRVANEKTTFAEAFVMADRVLFSGVGDPIVKEGLINLDFADLLTVMREKSSFAGAGVGKRPRGEGRLRKLSATQPKG